VRLAIIEHPHSLEGNEAPDDFIEYTWFGKPHPQEGSEISCKAVHVVGNTAQATVHACWIFHDGEWSVYFAERALSRRLESWPKIPEIFR
jgi:hypothetical protein